tara:strand:+ start:21493 stop:22026 length:534 start_codon:yes stop_codon:yes gene_type:complete
MLTLKGNNELNPLNLTGKSLCLGESNITIDIQFEKWKSRMMNRLVIPILQKNWSEIYDNIFVVSIFKKELEQFINCPDIEFYRNILTFVERVYNEHEELEHLEKLMYSDGGEGTRMMYKTTMIRIAAEYEIYHTIFGKPDNMEYDVDILGKIRSYMEIEDISYKEIKQKIENIYTNN